MGGKRGHDLDARVGGLNGPDRGLYVLLAAFLEGGAETHDHNGVLVCQLLELRIFTLQNAYLRCHLERGRGGFDFRIQAELLYLSIPILFPHSLDRKSVV